MLSNNISEVFRHNISSESQPMRKPGIINIPIIGSNICVSVSEYIDDVIIYKVKFLMV